MAVIKKRKVLVGEVISDRMDKTVVVQIRRTVQHPVYGKMIRQQTRLKAHDPKNECRTGDEVRVVECRPLSREKHWKVAGILARAKRLEPVAEQEGS